MSRTASVKPSGAFSSEALSLQFLRNRSSVDNTQTIECLAASGFSFPGQFGEYF